jgi:hypothetical protein
VVRPLLRILTAVAIAIATAVTLIRQPALTALDYGSRPRANARVLRDHVVFLTSTVAPRGVRQLHNLDAASRYIEEHFRRAGGAVSAQEYGRGKYRNVIARFGPTGGRAMIVGAHYDAFTLTGDLPGADDNAIGTAGLLELARLLGRHAPATAVILVAWSAEEPPFYGSVKWGAPFTRPASIPTASKA